jgi:uncharacterized membrane protein YhaH (DUF805 family)
MERKDLESMLSQVLVPVEPSARFVRRLRARLVTYEGGARISGWFIFVILVTAVLLIVASFGLFIRLLIALIGVAGLLGERRRRATDYPIAPA